MEETLAVVSLLPQAEMTGEDSPMRARYLHDYLPAEERWQRGKALRRRAAFVNHSARRRVAFEISLAGVIVIDRRGEDCKRALRRLQAGRKQLRAAAGEGEMISVFMISFSALLRPSSPSIRLASDTEDRPIH